MYKRISLGSLDIVTLFICLTPFSEKVPRLNMAFVEASGPIS